MTYSKEWLDFKESEDNFFRSRSAFMKNKEQMMSDLYAALLNAYDRETALRFLEDVSLDFVLSEKILPEVVDAAIDSGNINVIGLSKNVLYKYKDEANFRALLNKCINIYLAVEDDWHYRRIVEIYKLLGYNDELLRVISICKSSDNKDIREIGDDFS